MPTDRALKRAAEVRPMIAVWGAEEVLCREKSGSSLSWILCKELIESTYPCRGFIGFPVSLVNRVLCSDEPTRLCLATRNVWASYSAFLSS